MTTATRTKHQAQMGRSQFGTLQPQVHFLPAGGTYRTANATLYRFAAAVELATPATEGWVVCINQEYGRVYLELLEGSDAEALRGIAVLNQALNG